MAAPNDQQTGVALPLASIYTNFASFRWAQTQNAMLYGPTRIMEQGRLRTFGKSLFSWRATEEEMTRWRAGQSWGGKMLGRIPAGGIGGQNVNKIYGSFMNSPFSLSKWTSAAQLMTNPERYSAQASRLFMRDGYIDSALKMQAAMGKKAGVVNSVESGMRMADIDFMKGGGTAEYARKWTAEALKFGSNTNRQIGPLANRALNLSTGMMFNVDEGAVEIQRRLGGKAFNKMMKGVGYKAYQGESKFFQAMNAVESKGASIRALGEVSGFEVSKFGSAVGGIAKIGGNALAAYTIYTNAKMVGEGLYNLGELAFFKPAARAFQDLGALGERRMFAPTGPQGWVSSPTASSNRARAVQAIQGSKLNARSALGNEASLLAGHFG